MSHKKSRQTAVVGVGVLVAAGSIGVWSSAQAGAAHRSHRATDIVATTHHSTPLPANSTDKVTVLHLAVGPGQYVVSAAADLVNFEPSDYTRCQLTLNGTEIGATSAMVGDGTHGTNGDGSLVVPIAINAAGTVGSGGGTVEFRCWHDTAGRAPYVDPAPSLVVHRASVLKRVTE